MNQTSLTCRLGPHEMSKLSKVTTQELCEQFDLHAKKRSAHQKGHTYRDTSGSKQAKKLLQKVQVTLGITFAANEEKKIYQRKVQSLAAKHHSAAMFITITPNEN